MNEKRIIDLLKNEGIEMTCLISIIDNHLQVFHCEDTFGSRLALQYAMLDDKVLRHACAEVAHTALQYEVPYEDPIP